MVAALCALVCFIATSCIVSFHSLHLHLFYHFSLDSSVYCIHRSPGVFRRSVVLGKFVEYIAQGVLNCTY